MAERLIDAEALDKIIEFYQAAYSPIESRGNAFMFKALSAVKKMVADAPTIDAVEVVRCKDCKHFYCCSAVDRMFYCRHHCGLKHIQAVEEDSFCSYGERRQNETPR